MASALTTAVNGRLSPLCFIFRQILRFKKVIKHTDHELVNAVIK